MAPKLQTVHVRVNDAATGKPTPVRIRFTDMEGIYYAPLGRLTDFPADSNQNVGGNVRVASKPWAYTEGSFEINLPPGTITVEIHKGPEYRPLSQTFQLIPGKLALRFTIERWLDMPALGWYSGDGRAHALSPHAALLEAQAEDVHVVNLLADPTSLTNIMAFSGQLPALAAPGHLVVVNTHNTHAVLGSLGLLNCHRVVYPLTFGGPEDDWTTAAWCDQCHRKNGLVVWTCTTHENADGFLGEPLIDLLLGKVDAFEIEDSSSPALPLWYDLLQSGIRVPLVGSSGKDSNGSALGAVRTYAHSPPTESFQYPSWIEAVRAGRTFVTSGPILLLSVNKHEPGHVNPLQRAGETVHVRAEIKSLSPCESLEIIMNGQVAAITDKEILEVDLPIADSGWLAARCRGAPQNIEPHANQSLFAHTSPIYLRVEGLPQRKNPESVGRLLAQIERLENWAGGTERFLALTRAARARLSGGA